jgi:hypothetical protein
MLKSHTCQRNSLLASRRKAKGNKMNAAEIKFNKHMDARQNRRLAAEDRFLARIEKREAAAEQMIGELNSGKLYVYPVGGKYREGTRSELIAFLIRNNYA